MFWLYTPCTKSHILSWLHIPCCPDCMLHVVIVIFHVVLIIYPLLSWLHMPCCPDCIFHPYRITCCPDSICHVIIAYPMSSLYSFYTSCPHRITSTATSLRRRSRARCANTSASAWTRCACTCVDMRPSSRSNASYADVSTRRNTRWKCT